MYTFEFYDKKIHIPYDDDLFLAKPVITMAENKSWTVSAQILSDHPYFSELKVLKYGFKVYKKDRLIFRGRLTELKQKFGKLYNIFAEDKLAALNDSHCRPHEFSGTPEELFAWFIDNHNSQVTDEQKLLKGNVTVIDPNSYITRSWDKGDSTRKLMESRLLDTLGGYLVVRYEEDGDYLDWLEGFDLYSNQDIVFGENLLDIERIIDATETYTACIPYGAEIMNISYAEVDTSTTSWQIDKYYILTADETYSLIQTEETFNAAVSSGTTIYEVSSMEGTGKSLTIESVNDGKDYIINEAAAAEYGIIYAPTELVTWDDVTRPENLLSKSVDWLNNEGVMLKESVTLSAADLSAAGVENVNSFEMYQNVKAVIRPLNLDAAYLISGMKVDASASEVLQITVGSERRTLSAQIGDANKQANDIAQKVDKIESDYTTNDKMHSAIAEELITATSQILQTAEEITMGILSGYTSVSDLETYKQEIENLLKVNEDGFNFEFEQMESKLSELGNTVSTQSQYIRLIEGAIHIGHSDSPVTAVFDNDALEFRYNGSMVARFTNEVLEVRNISAENQVAFFDQWAIRKGAYVSGKGYNLNDVWIGG